MASSEEFVKFIADSLKDAGGIITYKKMFGEYGLWRDGKFFALVCDNQLFIKITKAGLALHPGFPTASPYEGAKEHFLIEDPEDSETLAELAVATCGDLPEPKKRKKKS